MKRHYKLLSFCIPFCLVLFSFAIINLYLGDNNFFVCDLRYQYLSIFCKLKDIISTNGSLFYSFSKSLGGGMFSTWTYYLGSPLNLLVTIFSKEYIIYMIEIIYFIKIGLCGLFMYIYLSKHFKKENPTILIASICYSLMAYNINYFWNIMWLDCVFYIPLVLLGIDNLIKKKNIKLYVICLFLAILSNYYIGFMLCIFSVIYFIYIMINTYNLKENKKDIRKDIITFIISSLIVGLLSCVILIPTMIELQNTVKNIGGGIIEPLKIIYNPFDIISKLFIGSNNSSIIINPNTTNIYCGLITIPLTLLYFFNKKISKKERIVSLIIIIIFYLSFSISYINMIWHGLSFPAFLNYRYSFLYCLFIIILSVKSFINLNKISRKECLIFSLIWLIICIIVFIINYIYLKKINIILSFIFMMLYIIVLYFYSSKKTKSTKKILIFLIIVELILNITLSLNEYNQNTPNTTNDYYFTKINNDMKDFVPLPNEFYRIETDFDFTFIDSMVFNYNGLTIFLSTIEDNIIHFLSRCGYSSGLNHALYSSGSTKIIDSILSIRYNLEKTEIVNEADKYEILYKVNRLNDYLPLGFMINSQNKNYQNIYNDPFEYQNMLFKYLYKDSKEYLVPYEITELEKNEFEININNNYDFYMYFGIYENNISYDIYLDNEYIKTVDYEHTLVELKNKYKNKTILKIVPNGNYNYEENLFVYYLNYDNFKEGINNLKQNSLNIETFRDDYIKGNILVPKDKTTLWTSIPYNTGWSIKVDGKEVKYNEIFETFISVELEEGNHEIEFIFKTKGLRIGIIIFIIGIISFIMVDKITKKSYSNNR